jgi:hypothetical protein
MHVDDVVITVCAGLASRTPPVPGTLCWTPLLTSSCGKWA